MVDYSSGDFVWDLGKEVLNVRKHGIDFVTAAQAFRDSRRKIYADFGHSSQEPRFFCIGKVGGRVITVRYIHRHGKIRIFGAGCWRKGVRQYEKED
jgi:uncharacterized DUF497 family protein